MAGPETFRSSGRPGSTEFPTGGLLPEASFTELRKEGTIPMSSSNTDSTVAGFNRRRFLALTAAGAALAVSPLGLGRARAMHQLTLMDLPYAKDALEPYISERTLDFHYGKHHAGYVRKTNGLLDEYKPGDVGLRDLVVWASKAEDRKPLFNNAAQVFNHNMYWQSMKPGGSRPNGMLMDKIQAAFGDLAGCKKRLAEAAGGRFGSGWAWLVWDGDKLRILSTSNAGNPITDGLSPLLTIDVWEHAYYLDYQNRRGEYIQAVLDNLINWDYAAQNLNACQ